MFVIAQTNIQLYNVLLGQQRSVEELAGVRSAYELAMQLFSAQFRANGKPFLAHVIGNASILASMRQPLPVVAAGLLHSAYSYGDFGDGERGITSPRQRRVEAVVGRDSAEIIASYHRLSRASAMRRLREPGSVAGDFLERTSLLIHLADMVEEYADCGIQFASVKRQVLQRECESDVAVETVAAVVSLGFAEYAPMFAEIFESANRGSPPSELVALRPEAYTLLPASADERIQLRCQRVWRKARQKAVKLFRRRNAINNRPIQGSAA